MGIKSLPHQGPLGLLAAGQLGPWAGQFAVAFERKFGQPLPSSLNDGQRILLVAPGNLRLQRRV